MADFQPAYKRLRTLEGYFLKDADGITYAGITQKYYPAWRGWFYLAKYPDLKIGEKCPDGRIEGLVEVFYLDEYWNRERYEEINNQDVAVAIFCQVVNSSTEGIILAQKAACVTADGIMGTETISKINSITAEVFLSAYQDEFERYYNEVAKNEPVKKNDLTGWISRIRNLCNLQNT